MRNISIIVPIYNREDSLSICIDSILQQSYKDFELILVDDGSTDHSLEICKSYSKIDSRIVVIHKKNGGVSSARNTGLCHAHGNWIRFVDSDDSLPSDSLEIYTNALDSSHADFYVSNYKTKIYSGKNLILDLEERIWKENVSDALIYMQEKGISGVPWNKLFKREIVEKYNIRFDEQMKCFEDEVFSLQYLQHAKSVYILAKPTYIYMDNQMERLSHSFLSLDDRVYAAENIFKLTTALSNSPKLHDDAKKHMALILFMGIKYVHYFGTAIPFGERIPYYHSVINYVERKGLLTDFLSWMKSTYKVKTTNPYLFDIIAITERYLRHLYRSFKTINTHYNE